MKKETQSHQKLESYPLNPNTCLSCLSPSTSSSNLENQPNTYLTHWLNSGAENMVVSLLFFLTWWTLADSYPDRSWALEAELATTLLHPPCLPNLFHVV